jgi:hypothetical protein
MRPLLWNATFEAERQSIDALVKLHGCMSIAWQSYMNPRVNSQKTIRTRPSSGVTEPKAPRSGSCSHMFYTPFGIRSAYTLLNFLR